MSATGGAAARRTCVWLCLAILTGWSGAVGAVTAVEPVIWGVGWADGVTVRRWLGRDWELSLAAGPDDRLRKDEVRAELLERPPQQQGALEVPVDTRQEQGWVRFEVGRRALTDGPWQMVGYAGVTYNWSDVQERALELDTLVGDYDTWERDRFTGRWMLALGLRPSWRAARFLTIAAAVGLEFVWEHWDQSDRRTYAGIDGADLIVTDGHGRSFHDFGWEGMSSLQFIVWF